MVLRLCQNCGRRRRCTYALRLRWWLCVPCLARTMRAGRRPTAHPNEGA